MNTVDIYVEGLRRLCELHGGADGVSEATGLSAANFKQILSGTLLPSGNPRGVGPAVKKRLAEVYPDWLDAVVARPPAPGDMPPNSFKVNATRVRKVFVVGRGSGGLMPERIWTDGDYPVGATDECAEIATSDQHAFITKVMGTSMIPRYNPSEYALVEPGTDPELEDDVLVRLETGQTMIKRLLSMRDGYRFGSYNTPEILHYPALEVTWVYYIAHPVPRRKIKTRC